MSTISKDTVLGDVRASTLSKQDSSGISVKGLFKRIGAQSVDPLTSEQQRKLRDALNLEAERIALAEAERIALVHAVCGKYASVLTSSEEFAAHKAEEIALEDRSR